MTSIDIEQGVAADEIVVIQDDDLAVIQIPGGQGPPGLPGPPGPPGPPGSPGTPAPVTYVVIAVTPAAISPHVRDVYFNVGLPSMATLPDAVNWAIANPGADARLLLKDLVGTAYTNNITIYGAGSNTIDGAPSIKISMPYGAYSLRVSPLNNWMIVG